MLPATLGGLRASPVTWSINKGDPNPSLIIHVNYTFPTMKALLSELKSFISGSGWPPGYPG